MGVALVGLGPSEGRAPGSFVAAIPSEAVSSLIECSGVAVAARDGRSELEGEPALAFQSPQRRRASRCMASGEVLKLTPDYMNSVRQMPVREWIDTGVTTIWLLAAGFCLYRALRALLVLQPARARLTHNGYRQARRQADGAFIRDNPAPMPALVEDIAAFTDHEGKERRVTLRRWAVPHDDDLLVWYAPDNPSKASAMGPVQWLFLFAFIGGAYILSWSV